MGKISKCEKKILIREAQHYQTYPSKTKLRKMNRTQLRKGEMKERIEYEITRNYGKQIERTIVWIKDKEKNKEITEKARKILEEKYREKELIKESEKQFEKERDKPKYSIRIEYTCVKCGNNSKWHGCIYEK
jgi:ribosomal protein L44E